MINTPTPLLPNGWPSVHVGDTIWVGKRPRKVVGVSNRGGVAIKASNGMHVEVKNWTKEKPA